MGGWDSAVQSHSMGGFMGESRGTHRGTRTGKYMRMLHLPLAAYPLKSPREQRVYEICNLTPHCAVSSQHFPVFLHSSPHSQEENPPGKIHPNKKKSSERVFLNNFVGFMTRVTGKQGKARAKFPKRFA